MSDPITENAFVQGIIFGAIGTVAWWLVIGAVVKMIRWAIDSNRRRRMWEAESRAFMDAHPDWIPDEITMGLLRDLARPRRDSVWRRFVRWFLS
jgi:hypothetical protein